MYRLHVIVEINHLFKVFEINLRDSHISTNVFVYAQLVWTMHKICKVRGSNLGHHKKKIVYV